MSVFSGISVAIASHDNSIRYIMAAEIVLKINQFWKEPTVYKYYISRIPPSIGQSQIYGPGEVTALT